MSTPLSIHARCDIFWHWNRYDERRLYTPSFRPYLSTRSNVLFLTITRLLLATFVFCGSAQVSVFFTSTEPTYVHAIYLSNHGMWVTAAYLICSALLTLARFIAEETHNNELIELISPHIPQLQITHPQSFLQLFVLGWKRAIMILLSIAIFEETIILPLYWFLLYPPGLNSFFNWLMIMTHGVGYVVLLFDVLVLSSHRLVCRQWLAALCSALFYLLMNLAYTFGGPGYGGKPPYGSILSWRSIWSLIWILICILLGFIGYVYMQSLIIVRIKCVNSLSYCDRYRNHQSIVTPTPENSVSVIVANTTENSGGAILTGANKDSNVNVYNNTEENRWQISYPRSFSDDQEIRVCSNSCFTCWHKK